MTNAQTIDRVQEMLTNGEGYLTEAGEATLRKMIHDYYSVEECSYETSKSRESKDRASTNE